jgi:microcystin-dependent protein
MIGTTFGGDGLTTFALPDLRGHTIVGASSFDPVGAFFGLPDVTLNSNQMPTQMGGGGQPFNNVDPSLSLNYIICLWGNYPSTQTGSFDSSSPVLSEITAVAFTGIPRGWALCAGQLLPISQNQALFSLLGTQFGGNGQTTFALPDLRGRAVIGTG